MTRPRILFAANLHWNAGSSHILAQYAAAAPDAGCEVGVSAQLSRFDDQVASYLPVITDLGWATHLVLVFEGRQFLTAERLSLCERIPRHRRAIIDADGHWGAMVKAGADSSAGAYPAESWRHLYTSLSDLVLQPKLAGELPAGAQAFSYFGMPLPHWGGEARPAGDMPFQVQYIGSNWWRWNALTSLVQAAHGASPPIRRMRVCGRWWDGQTCPGHETATVSEPGWLRRHGVVLEPPVPFGRVVSEMARAAISPVLVRPVLAALGFATPRMFETVAAGSLPAFTDDVICLRQLYDLEADAFRLGDDPGDTLSRMLRDHRLYRRQLVRLRARLQHEFAYPKLLATLLGIIG